MGTVYSPESVGYSELMWDLPRMLRAPTAAEGCFNASAQLSPTAIAPAVWSITNPGNKFPLFFRISFSTDTAIQWSLYDNSGAPGFAAMGISRLGYGGAGGNMGAQAAVAVPGAQAGLIAGGYAAAGSLTDILLGKWLLDDIGTSLNLVTSMVAANCVASFWWAEYALQ